MFLSVVLPVYNEQDVLPALFPHLLPVLESLRMEFEVIFVNDGSTDATQSILEQYAQNDSRIKLLRFSRNFGQQAGITAGLDFARGDAIVVMDADLQDPPELIPIMLENLSKGFDVVSTRKISRYGETYCKRKTASLFYQLMRSTVDERLPPEVGDFRMFSRGAVIAIKQFREQHRFMRGLVAWLGLNECILPFERPARVAGETKYSSIKLAKLAWTAISSFTALPLKLPFYAGVVLLLSGVVFSVYTFVAGLLTQQSLSAWSWLVSLQLVVHGITLAAIGLLGDYVGRIYDEAKQRPLYVIADGKNIAHDSPQSRTVWIPPMESVIPTRQPNEMEQPAWQAERRAA